MLILSRHIGESITLEMPDGQRVQIMVTSLYGKPQNRAWLGITAAPEVVIYRSELEFQKVAHLRDRQQKGGPHV